MLKIKLFKLFLILWLSIAESHETKLPHFTANTTTVEVNEKIDFKCDVSQLDYWSTSNYEVHIIFNANYFSYAYYAVTYDNLTHQQRVSPGRTETYNGITVSLGSHTPPVFEFLTQISNQYLNQFEHFGCQVLQGDWIKSNLISVATLPKVPKLTFTTNVSEVEDKKPFTITCSIDNFETNQNYNVKFLNSRDGLLGTFEIELNKEPLITFERHPNVTVSFGNKFKYPNFDLVIVESNNAFQSYWCSLEYKNALNNISFKSNHWPTAKLEFSSTTANKITTGRCAMSNFDSLNNSYTVKFLSDFGPTTNNLLATYTITPGKPELFITEPSNLYTNITHGVHRFFPIFEIIVNFAPNSNKWWCTLIINDPSHSNYKKFESNKIQIE